MTEDQEAEAAEQAEDASEEESGLQRGDFVELEYTAYTVEEETLVDTTDEEVAEEEGIDTQGREFGPRTIGLGQGHIFESVEEAVIGSEPGDEGTVTVPAAEAFGEYDPDNVQTVSAEKIDEDDRYPGANVQVNGRQGYISTIIGGRARVDFNHPLAGEDVKYEYKILDLVKDKAKRAAGLFEMMLGFKPEVRIETDEVEEEVPVESDEDDEDDEDSEPEFETQTVEKETLYLEASPQLTMDQQWLMGKQQIGQQVIEQTGVDRIVVEEVIEGMGGMMGGLGGLEEQLEDADVDAEAIMEEIEGQSE